MEAYAVIQTGGKQYRVSAGNLLDVDRLTAAVVGTDFTFEEVLAVSDGQALKVGQPAVAGASVTAQIVENRRGTKIVSFKKKRRKGYHRKIGHRQELTRVKISAIHG